MEELAEGDPAAVALENARRKAAAVDGGELPVLACDTIVTIDGRILGKPRDAAQAAEYLHLLQDRAHEVLSGLVLGSREALARTTVRFRTLDAAEIASYVATGEWEGRAGGYAIQGRGAALVRAVEGDYFNVVGLPVAALIDLADQ